MLRTATAWKSAREYARALLSNPVAVFAFPMRWQLSTAAAMRGAPHQDPDMTLTGNQNPQTSSYTGICPLLRVVA